MNALDESTKMALLAALRQVGSDRRVRCVVLTGTGRAFCVGQDLREHADRLAGEGPERVWSTVPEHYNPIATLLHTIAQAGDRRRQRGGRRRGRLDRVPGRPAARE